MGLARFSEDKGAGSTVASKSEFHGNQDSELAHDFNKGDRSKIKNRQALVIFASGKQIIEDLPNEADILRKRANQMFASALELILRD